MPTNYPVNRGTGATLHLDVTECVKLKPELELLGAPKRITNITIEAPEGDVVRISYTCVATDLELKLLAPDLLMSLQGKL